MEKFLNLTTNLIFKLFINQRSFSDYKPLRQPCLLKWRHVKVSLLINVLTGLTLTAIHFRIDLILPGQLKVNFSTGAAIKILSSYWMSKFCNRNLYAITKDYSNRSRNTVNLLPCFKPPTSCKIEKWFFYYLTLLNFFKNFLATHIFSLQYLKFVLIFQPNSLIIFSKQ